MNDREGEALHRELRKLLDELEKRAKDKDGNLSEDDDDEPISEPAPE